MIEFKDKKNGLVWVIYNLEQDYNNKRIKNKLERLNSSLNRWQGEDIDTYVTGGERLGDYFYTLLHYKPRSLIEAFAYNKNKALAGCCILANNALDIHNLDGVNTEDLKPNLRIEFIVTNPKLRNRGLATRMTCSIRDNQEVFTNGRDSLGVSSAIDVTNEPSEKLFKKCGFLHKASHLPQYKIYYFKKQVKAPNTPKETHEPSK